MGKGAKIAIVNLKRSTWDSGKFKGAKPYTANYNEANVTSWLSIVKRNFFQMWVPPSVNDVSIPKFIVEAEMHQVEPYII